MKRMVRLFVVAIVLFVAGVPIASAASLQNGRWYKACDGDFCIVGIRSRQGVSYFVREDPSQQQSRLLAVARVWPDVLLPYGVTWTIDRGLEIRVPFVKCDGNWCAAQVVLNEDYLAQLKSGASYRLGVNVDGRDKVVELTLRGFSAAWDGGPTASLADLSAFFGAK